MLRLLGAFAVAMVALASCRARAPVLRSAWMEVAVPPREEAPAGRLVTGEALYGWNCMPCHGAEGKGDGPVAERIGLRPRDLTRGLFQLKTSGPGEMPFDDDLYRTIAAGIPISGMPAVKNLTPDDRWALVAYLKQLAAEHFRTSPARTRIPVASEADPVRGSRLYSAACSACHGAAGRGDGPSAAGLTDALARAAPIPDLTRGEIAFKAGSRPEDVARVLAAGMPGTPMPSYASLPPEDLRDMASFVVSLYQPVSAGERLYVTSGCVACHTIGRGRLYGPDLAGVATRRSRAWLTRFLKDPAAMIASDADAKRMYEEFGAAMPAVPLPDGELGALIDYLSAP